MRQRIGRCCGRCVRGAACSWARRSPGSSPAGWPAQAVRAPGRRTRTGGFRGGPRPGLRGGAGNLIPHGVGDLDIGGLSTGRATAPSPSWRSTPSWWRPCSARSRRPDTALRRWRPWSSRRRCAPIRRPRTPRSSGRGSPSSISDVRRAGAGGSAVRAARPAPVAADRARGGHGAARPLRARGSRCCSPRSPRRGVQHAAPDAAGHGPRPADDDRLRAHAAGEGASWRSSQRSPSPPGSGCAARDRTAARASRAEVVVPRRGGGVGGADGAAAADPPVMWPGPAVAGDEDLQGGALVHRLVPPGTPSMPTVSRRRRASGSMVPSRTSGSSSGCRCASGRRRRAARCSGRT